MGEWCEKDELWSDMTPKIFTSHHWESAPLEVESLVSLLNLNTGDSILDLCCGPGRHSLELARKGFIVTGVDRFPMYLDRAREQAMVEGLSIEFIQGDMRTFCNVSEYDAVLNMYSSFGYFDNPDDDKRVLSNIHASLKEGGRLLMDLMGKEVLAGVFLERDWQEEQGILFLEERKITDNWDYIRNRWIRIDGEKRAEHTFSLRLYSGQELYDLLKEAGFGDIRLFGDLNGIPYDHNAYRLVAVARI